MTKLQHSAQHYRVLWQLRMSTRTHELCRPEDSISLTKKSRYVSIRPHTSDLMLIDSALPADTKRWNHPRRPAADRIILEKSPSSLTVNATAGFPSPRRSFSNREKPIGFGGPSSLDQGQPALIPIQGDAHRELDDNRAEKRADVESEDYEKEEVGLDHDPRDSDNDEHSAKFDCIAAAPRPWTAGDLCNPNDPRSYKFLPR